MNKIWVVARHEFVTTVKRIGFLLVAIGLPLLFAGITTFAVYLQQKTAIEDKDRIEKARLGIVDESGIATKPAPEKVTWIRYATLEEARKRMGADDLEILLHLPADYLKTGKVDVETTIRPSPFTMGGTFVPIEFREYLIKCVLSHESPENIERSLDPVTAQVRFILPDKVKIESAAEYVARMVTAAFFFFLLFTSISVAGGYLIQGMADEKENRVLEMVISSVTPTQLMAGKLIGLGAAGMLQVAIWSAMGSSTAIFFAFSVALNPGLFAFCALFFILGYLLYGSLLLGIGSLGSNQRESMQYTWVLTMVVFSPVFVWMNILAAPQSTLARVFTFIPLTTPTTIIMRYAIDPTGTPTWEIIAAIALLIVSTLLALRISARLYRIGLLLYGKRPTPREIWRWMWVG